LAVLAAGAGVPRTAGGRRASSPPARRNRVISRSELQGTVPMWGWIGDVAATTFSY